MPRAAIQLLSEGDWGFGPLQDSPAAYVFRSTLNLNRKRIDPAEVVAAPRTR
jgi:hypothetical protein